MKCVTIASQAIKLGDAKVVVAGGMESMSNASYALEKGRTGYRMGHGAILDLMIHDGLWDPYNNIHMGDCGDLCAREHRYTREQADQYAVESYRRAVAAQREHKFADEIVPVEIPQRKGASLLVKEDEEPGRGETAKFGSLRPAFNAEGVTTAANASSIDDGAAALVLVARSEAERRGLKPLGVVAAYSTHAQDPQWFTTAPAAAIRKLLEATGLRVKDIDLFEINEAFSVVPMYAAEQLDIPKDKLNVNGGAVALGHPIGMTSARLVLTALHELRRRGGKYAIASPCIGGGEATAVLVEAL
jgi:acetyl-CoA C-acetyltransferase